MSRVTEYEVTAACVAHVPAMTSNGPMLTTLYKGQRLPANVPQKRIDFLLKGKMIRPVGGQAPDQVETPVLVEAPPTAGPGSGKAAWVDYAESRGMDRDAAESMTRDELIESLKG